MEIEYLEAKRNLDDRSMNQRVWSRFEWAACTRARESREGVRIVELGAGSGGMVERLESWGLLKAMDEEATVRYEVVEPRQDFLSNLEGRLKSKNLRGGYRVFHGTAREYLESDARGSADILLAHAVLDLVSAREASAVTAEILKPGGLLYATITFDGESFFEPEIDRNLDEKVRRIYRESMVRDRGGETGFGRKLLVRLQEAGFLIDEAGGSDWVVVPQDGEYRPGEELVVRTVLGMVSTEMSGRIDQETGNRWSRERLAQLDRKELIFIAHQLDLLARRPG